MPGDRYCAHRNAQRPILRVTAVEPTRTAPKDFTTYDNFPGHRHHYPGLDRNATLQ
jgi:hypothetical protein